MNAKEEARKLVEQLPDGISWDDMLYEFYLRQKVIAGLEDADAGRVLPHEGVEKQFLSP